MARRAISERSNAATHDRRCGRAAGGRPPAHHRDRVGRSEMRPGRSMAIDTPRHRERRDLLDLSHAIDSTMTVFTPYALRHVHRVIEVHVVRQLCHTPPWDRPSAGHAVANRGHWRAAHPETGMAGHARLRRRKSCPSTPVGSGVAVEAIHTQPGHVNSVIEPHRLREASVFAARPRRADPTHRRSGHAQGERRHGENRDARHARRVRCEER